MAVDSGAVTNENVSGKKENVGPSSPPKRNKCPGVRVVGGRIYDSINGKTCHQCRQKTRDFAAACTNQKNNKPCTIKYCHKCLLNRYGEKAEEVAALGDWCCPKCRGICNCSFCMKKRGCQPTGILIKTAKASGFSSVSEMLTKGAEHLNREKVIATPEKGKDCIGDHKTSSEKISQSPDKSKTKAKKTKRDRSAEMMNNATNDEETLEETSGHNDEKKPKKSKKDELENVTVTEKEFVEPFENDKRKEEDSKTAKADLYAEVPLPIGSELKNVCGIDVRAEDVGNALQFLEFCAVFGEASDFNYIDIILHFYEILKVEKGQPELVLQDLLHGRTGLRGKFSLTVQFHIDLLSILQTELGEEDATLSHGNDSWFIALKECLSESESVLTQNGLDCLEKADDYETLDTSQKLRLLNLLCDEVLATEKLRNWMDDQNVKLAEKVKEAKKEVLAAKDKEKSLKQKMKDDIAKAIIASQSALSFAEHEAIVSSIKSEMALANAKVLKSKGIILKNNQTSDAVRTERLFMGDGGHAYWKLNCLGKSDVLHQDVGQGDSLTLDEKWFTIDDEGKEAVEKHISAIKKGKKLRE
ncbi:hypothetical protein BUALT_Bualt11G0053800 [Buddleja alternifolia]|uniref:Zinc-finger domain-containing protein n=1 Tax=Buddleja alternifolia TaxID=168488 RepID=A0AAV6WZU2_9LAMI|nr:hypothetical protein BUALT_Bualt11G0053800 [Buddleja alternifolia]